MLQLAVDAVRVSKRYGNRDVLNEVDLAVQPGQLHGLLGPNGAGKTTLIRVLLGLARRSAGAVRLLGHELGPAGHPVPSGVGAVVETSAFYPYLTARQNLALLARLDGPTTGGRGVDDALAAVGLAAHADAMVRGYSAGMRQRLGLAAARLRAPRLLFLDEPTSSLDPGSALQVRDLVRRMANEGTAVVFSSHDMAEVEEMCAALTVLDYGRVVFSGSVERLRARTLGSVVTIRTSDDATATSVAAGHHRLRRLPPCGKGLELIGDVDAVDAFVIALGQAGIAVRLLERRARSLESLFLDLTGGGSPLRARPTPHPRGSSAPEPAATPS
jgi:ABC-2 type transport system ATP-binding protein